MQAGMARVAAAYQEIEIKSRSQLELVVMLYDGAVRFMTGAADAIRRKDLTAKREAVSRALAVVSELQSTLNLKEGGELARSLDSLYTFVTERLLHANMNGDAGAIEEALRIIRALREGWIEIAARPPETLPVEAP